MSSLCPWFGFQAKQEMPQPKDPEYTFSQSTAVHCKLLVIYLFIYLFKEQIFACSCDSFPDAVNNSTCLWLCMEHTDNPFMAEKDPFALGVELMKRGDLKQAILAFEAAVQKTPENAVCSNGSCMFSHAATIFQ